MLTRRKRYLVVVLLEDLDVDSLPAEIRTYLRTYTYIDARNHENKLERIRKRIRFVMPGTPLVKIKAMQSGIDNTETEQFTEDLTAAYHLNAVNMVRAGEREDLSLY